LREKKEGKEKAGFFSYERQAQRGTGAPAGAGTLTFF
jgi:hypothetical protein